LLSPVDVAVLASTLAAPEMEAVVSTLTMFKASDPAIPTLLPPAPDVALANIVSVGVAAPCNAAIFTPAALWVPCPSFAVFLAVITLTDTATPIPTFD